MGVIYIKEENPFAEFVKGLSPVVDAWGKRYQERGKANLSNEIEQYKNAKAPTVMAKDLLTNGYQYQEATPEMFSDEGFMNWSPGKFTMNTPTEDLARAYASTTPDFMGIKLNERPEPKDPFAIEPFRYDAATPTSRLVQDALPSIAQQMVNTQDSRVAQANTQALADFDTARSAQKADLLKRGADYYGAQGMQELLNAADQQRRIEEVGSRLGPKSSYQDVMTAYRDTALANGDLAAAAKITEGYAPDFGISSINFGKETGIIKHDRKNPSATTIDYIENSMTPYQKEGIIEKGKDREFDLQKMGIQHRYKMDELVFQAKNGNKDAWKELELTVRLAGLEEKGLEEWRKQPGNLTADIKNYPGYSRLLQAYAARDYIWNKLGFSGGNQGGGGQPSPQQPNQPGNYSVQELPTNEYRQAMNKVREDAKAQGKNLSDNEIMIILENEFNIKWKSSAR